MKGYIKNYIWEFIVCTIICGCLIINVSQGFYIPDSMADNVLMAFGLSAILVAIFYLISYNRITAIIGFIVVVAAVVAAFLLMAANGVDIVDQESSDSAFVIYWFIFAIVCIIVFFLSRFRIGVAIVFLLGIAVSALMEYLTFESPTWTTILAAVCCIILFMLRQHRVRAMNSSTSDPQFGKFSAMAAVIALAAALVGSGIYYTVIKPLNPPTATVQFFERYNIYDILEMLGITDDYQIPDNDKRTNNKGDDTVNSDETDEETTTAPEEPETTTSTNNELDGSQDAGIILEDTLTLNLTTLAKILILIGIIILAIVLPPLIKYLLRKRRMKKLSELDGREQAVEFYNFYMKEFSHLGWKRNKSETVNEFALRAGEPLERFLRGGLSLKELTDIFMDARYGGNTPSEETLEKCRMLYPLLIKNAKKQLGFKYIFKYYVL